MSEERGVLYVASASCPQEPSEVEALKARIVTLEKTEAFLRSRRGKLVIERDAYQAHVFNLIAAIENDGKTSSLHDWNERMKRAVSDARRMSEGLTNLADATNKKDQS